MPPATRATFGGGDGDAGTLSLLLEVNAFAIVGADDDSVYPELSAIEGGDPELAFARLGLAGASACRPWAFVARLDLAAGLALATADLEDDTAASLLSFVDDAAVWWTPHVAASVVAGRVRVPFSRHRLVAAALRTGGAVPFIVDRVAPDRRLGATFHGDLGALSYALGAYEDVDVLELRAGDRDPSAGGRAAFAFHAEWTPRAPVGEDTIATSPADPWYPVARVSAGLGTLVRLRDPDRGARLDVAFSTMVMYRFLWTTGELLASADADELVFAGTLDAGLNVGKRVALFGRGEYDPVALRTEDGAPIAVWTAGGGASWFVTPDRRNRVSFVGFFRRDRDDGLPRDGAMVQLQASL